MASLTEQGKHYTSGNIKTVYSDMFKVSAQTFAECMGMHARADLTALPKSMRPSYLERMYGRLVGPCEPQLIQ